RGLPTESRLDPSTEPSARGVDRVLFPGPQAGSMSTIAPSGACRKVKVCPVGSRASYSEAKSRPGMELEVSLQFECCQCNQPVGVTLKCEGTGLLGGCRTVAAVKIPCP